MNPTDIYIKTSSGTEELRSRARKLSPRLRTMLIMVDGVRSVAELPDAALSLGAPADFLVTLELDGLVSARPPQVQKVPAPAAPPATAAVTLAAAAQVDIPVEEDGGVDRFTAARKLMNDTAVDALGFRAFLFTLKLERCSTSQDLLLLRPEFNQSLAKARGELFARRVADRLRSLLD